MLKANGRCSACKFLFGRVLGKIPLDKSKPPWEGNIGSVREIGCEHVKLVAVSERDTKCESRD